MNYSAIAGFLEGLKPVELLTVSEWAEKYRVLSSESSFSPGLYSCDKTPYTRKIMDSLGVHSPYKEVVFCKSSQTGGTELGNNWIGYIIHMAPGPTLMLMPTDGTVERNSKVRIDPMISACKELRERVAAKKSRDGENTINQKKFPGGVLYMGGANSPAVLKSVPVRYVMLDEVDEYSSDLAGQGDACELAEVRTRFFPNKKIFYVSTPTIEGLSIIKKKFLQTDQNYFNVPCPHCGTFQVLKFEQLKWEKGKHKETKYQCIHCDQLIEERFKPEMLAQGHWEPSVRENVNDDIIGFHINSLYAPYGIFTWGDIAKKFETVKDDPSLLKVFINTILGETWAESGEAPKFENLYNRRESYKQNKPCKNVCFITVGVDVQKDRIELEIVGWGKDKQSWSIDYRTLVGNTSLPDVWQELDKVVNETWVREDGIELGCRLMAIDSGYNTTEVYSFCRKYSVSKVVPIKGRDNLSVAFMPPKTIDYNIKGKKIGKIKVWNVGSSHLKSELYGWLNLEQSNGVYPPCYCHFPQYDENYFKGLTAEDYMPITGKWRKRFERNEPLDCRNYARAASVIVGLDRLKPENIESMSGNTYVKQSKTDSYFEKKRKNYDSIW